MNPYIATDTLWIFVVIYICLQDLLHLAAFDHKLNHPLLTLPVIKVCQYSVPYLTAKARVSEYSHTNNLADPFNTVSVSSLNIISPVKTMSYFY